MADEMDPCECIWSHELAMRRLLSWIRQTQAYCTDTECLDELPGASPQIPIDNFLMMTLIVGFALIMFFMRPNSMRNGNYDSKPPGNMGGNGSPPPPAIS